MLKKGIITSIFENYRNIDILCELSDSEISFLKDRIDKIDMYKLYKYEFHGIFHSQKVMLFAYLIGKHQNLNYEDMKILLDAAIYHDMGRDSDFEETTHGYSSTLRYARLFANDEFYNDPLNFELLKAITDGHSVDDAKKVKIFNDYDIDQQYYDRYSTLYNILKDADALDRARFPKSAKASIKEEFLRLEFSKTLIDFAFVLNGIYRTKIDEANFEKYKNEYFSGDQENFCLHGIGFDFSKLEGILDNGILSGYTAMQKGISVSRNFEGNNSDMWISVIDSMDVSKQGSAYKQFADSNISFFCRVMKYRVGEKNSAKAQSHGLPIDSGLYEGESFVFSEIPKEDIYGIILPAKSEHLKLSELNYLYCSKNFKTIRNRVESYCNYIEKLTGITIDKVELDQLIEELYELEIDFGLKPADYQRRNAQHFFDNVDLIVNKINIVLAKWISLSFKEYFMLDAEIEPTVSMVVSDILKRKNIDYTLMGDETTETIIRLMEKEKDIDSNKSK